MRVRLPGMTTPSKEGAGDARAAPQHGQIAGAAHAEHCFETLVAHFSGQEQPRATYPDSTCPLFVTWNKAPARPNAGPFSLRGRRGAWRLRGCIGTLAARQLHTALPEYALTAALRDRRFPPISPSEVALLRCTVSLLHGFERAASWTDWQVGVHGLIISFTDPETLQPRTATFLPEVAEAEGWSVSQTIDVLVRKAGYDGFVTPALRDSLQITRYKSTTHSLTYEEFTAAAALADGATTEPAEQLQPGSPLVGAVPA